MSDTASVTARDVVLLARRDADLLFDALTSDDPDTIVRAIAHHKETEAFLASFMFTKTEMYCRSVIAPKVHGRTRYTDTTMPKRCKNVFEKLGIEFLDEIKNYTMSQCSALGNCKKATLVALSHYLAKDGVFFKSESATEEQWKEDRGLL